MRRDEIFGHRVASFILEPIDYQENGLWSWEQKEHSHWRDPDQRSMIDTIASVTGSNKVTPSLISVLSTNMPGFISLPSSGRVETKAQHSLVTYLQPDQRPLSHRTSLDPSEQ